MFSHNDFHQLIAELVDIKIRSHGETREDIAAALGLTESFVKKVHSPTAEKHYNVTHLFLLANHWNIEFSDLIPSAATLSKLVRYEGYSIIELQEKIDEMITVLRKDQNYE